jgi:hypothetical protein
MSTDEMTCGVDVEDGRIVDAPPIVKKFIGQPIENFRDWMSKQKGGCKEIEISHDITGTLPLTSGMEHF